MPTVYWGDTLANGNLAASGNYIGGSLPTSGDTLIFDRGHTDILGGSGLTGAALAAVIFTEGYRGNKVGAAGNPAKFRTTSFTFASRTVGTAVVQGVTAFTNVDIRHLPGTFHIAASTPDITKLYLGTGPGYCEVATSVSVTDFKTAGMGCLLSPDATSPPNMTARIAAGANVESQRRISKAVVDGFLNVTNSGTLTHGTAASAECIVTGTGRLNLATKGTVTRLERLPRSRVTFEGATRDVTIGQDIAYIGAVMEQPIGISVSLSADQVSIGQGTTA
jgi:hypothetical protein